MTRTPFHLQGVTWLRQARRRTSGFLHTRLAAAGFLHTGTARSGAQLAVAAALTGVVALAVHTGLSVETPRSTRRSASEPVPIVVQDPAYAAGSFTYPDELVPPDEPAPEPGPVMDPGPVQPEPEPAPRDAQTVLACIRWHESRDRYDAVNAGSGASGAYQFLPSTWDRTAAWADRPDLIGLDPASVDPATQDAMALALLEWQGTAPWAGSGC